MIEGRTHSSVTLRNGLELLGRRDGRNEVEESFEVKEWVSEGMF